MGALVFDGQREVDDGNYLGVIVTPILLLIASNVFMTVAWYGHLRFHEVPLWQVILVSWGIAFFEYCLQVPANRMGHLQGYSGFQLKIVQEVITLTVFVGFAVLWLKERPTMNHVFAGLCLVGAVFFAFRDRTPPAPLEQSTSAVK